MEVLTPSGPPQMAVYQAIWALDGYGGAGREWSLEEKFERMAEAGFTGVFGRLPEPGKEKLWRELQERYKFTFGVESFPYGRDDFREFLKRAKEFDVTYINAQVGSSFTVGDKAVALLSDLIEEAELSGIPFYVETHRGKVTQDVLRTVEYARRLPNLRLTIDFSHYVLAGEMHSAEEAEPYFDELLRRTASIHARVSNAEQIQIDIGPDGDHPKAEPFKRWWERGMRYWREQAQPGDVLPFVCEIGRHYAITRSGLPSAGSHDEWSDRWEQSLVFKRIAEDLWSRVAGE
ncbi:sugar phosphate isomerase/epimerase family protein [Paenibacillus hamazuiensis]|uniref:sugar phosphate isomerase/epimerase family protein n=1 Tax=Paenibacillus hamazuiensis TaxID=2936508 RepID=UPI00200E6693|nr:TIM barrel protein [Paenibacillus hamazuiensis]